MKISVLEVTKSNIKVRFNAPVAFSNAIRRIILSEVPSCAIDLVEIDENNTVLADEMISHRLGLVPIIVYKDLVFKEECDCNKYCVRCSVILNLHCENTGTVPICVTGEDLVVENTQVNLVAEKTKVKIHNSLILKLAPRHSIKLKCIVRRGSPKTHVKYCTAAVIGFNYDPRNATRSTNLWHEEDPVKEWPMVNQEPSIDWNEPEEVNMNIEVVEGTTTPNDLLSNALKIMKNKFKAIYDLTE